MSTASTVTTITPAGAVCGARGAVGVGGTLFTGSVGIAPVDGVVGVGAGVTGVGVSCPGGGTTSITGFVGFGGSITSIVSCST